MIKILFRDINGIKTEIETHNVDRLIDIITDEDEILIVWYESQIVWCGLGKDCSLTVDDITGFFA